MGYSRKKLDLMGQRFGKLTVIGPAENIGTRTAWRCRCDCGRETVVRTLHLRDGHVSSCGCNESGLTSLTYVDDTCVEMLAAKFGRCDYYLDINHDSEIVSAVKQAFLHNQLILGFRQTLHNKAFISNEHVFSEYEAMAAFLKKIMGNETMIEKQLELQKKAAMSENAAAYAKLLKKK